MVSGKTDIVNLEKILGNDIPHLWRHARNFGQRKLATHSLSHTGHIDFENIA